MKFKQLISGAMATALALSVSVMPALAAAPTADGNYTADLFMANYSHITNGVENPDASMSNDAFIPEVEVTIAGDEATVTVYVVSPLPNPAFNTLDPSISNLTYYYNDVEYLAVDMTGDGEKPMKTVANSSALFGTTAGESYATRAYEATLPVAVLGETYIKVGAFVAPMGGNVDIGMNISNYVAVGDEGTVAPTTQGMDITATVEKNVAVATVVIPESTALGTLSKDEVTTATYEVVANIGNSGKTATVTTAGGTLTSEDGTKTIAVANAFGTDGVATFAADGTEQGTLTVEAADVAAAATDADQSFAGTINFIIAIA